MQSLKFLPTFLVCFCIKMRARCLDHSANTDRGERRRICPRLCFLIPTEKKLRSLEVWGKAATCRRSSSEKEKKSTAAKPQTKGGVLFLSIWEMNLWGVICGLFTWATTLFTFRLICVMVFKGWPNRFELHSCAACSWQFYAPGFLVRASLSVLVLFYSLLLLQM